MMSAKSSVDKEAAGSIVAFEGHPATVSTQLQLLPRSAQILLLPGIETYLPAEDDEWQLGYERYIAAVDAAVHSRNDIATSFLQASTPKNRRLVFMAGGAPSAMALCIDRIMKQETDGDQKKAEQILRKHIASEPTTHIPSHFSYMKSSPFALSTHNGAKDDLQDPILKAMRAADALDLLTADLQPSNDLDLTIQHRSRSVSLPIFGCSDSNTALDAMPVPEIPPEHQMASPAPLKTPVFNTIHYDKPCGYSSPVDASSLVSPGYAKRFSIASSIRASSELSGASPTSDGFSIRTIDDIVVGQASMLDMRHSIRMGSWKPPQRKSSLRPKSAGSEFSGYQGFDSSSSVSDYESAEEYEHDGDLASNGTIRPKSCMVVVDHSHPGKSQLQSIDRPRTVVVKSSQSTIKLQPVPPEKKRRTPPNGNRAEEQKDAEQQKPPSCTASHFASLENVVLHIKEDNGSKSLVSALQVFRRGEFTSRQKSAESLPTPRSKGIVSLPGTPKTPSPSKELGKASPKDETSTVAQQEYDPFAYTQPMRQTPEKPGSAPSTVTIIRPPTPAQTPPPLDSMVNVTFQDIDVTANQTPVAIQNSIRSALREYFAPHAQGYHQFQFNLLPEFEGLWSPMFRTVEAEDTSKDDTVKVKQVLAISAQSGISREFSSNVYKTLESTGSKDSATGRCARLNFRYLLANTMQAFTAQPLAKQTLDNPFSNPYFLATLIMPHLETYLALHADIRYLLLEHPPEHLSTVLALQKLAGSQLIKVAQLVEGKDTNRESPFRHMRGTSLDSLQSGSIVSSRVSSGTRANLLLTATSSERDIAKFVSKVWDIAASDDTQSSPPSKPSQPSRSALTTLTATAENGMTALSPPGRPSFSSQSVSDKARKLERSKSKAKPVDDAVSIVTYDPNEDSDYDQEERRLMPMFMHKKRSTKNVSTTKALRFLGLE